MVPAYDKQFFKAILLELEKFAIFKRFDTLNIEIEDKN